MKCFCVAAALCGAKVLRYLAFVPAFVWPKSLKARKTHRQKQPYNLFAIAKLPFLTILGNT
jgi:hypothetical protein